MDNQATKQAYQDFMRYLKASDLSAMKSTSQFYQQATALLEGFDDPQLKVALKSGLDLYRRQFVDPYEAQNPNFRLIKLKINAAFDAIRDMIDADPREILRHGMTIYESVFEEHVGLNI